MQNKKFRSYTYGQVNLLDIAKYLLEFYTKNKIYNTEFVITIGTDSQNFYNTTKIVNVISIICKGHGGIFFYNISHLDCISDIRVKLREETKESLEIAEELVNILQDNEVYHEMFLNIPIQLHIDAGNTDKNKTKMLISELVGWVVASGYDACIKPDSYAASSIADRISK